MKEIVSIDSPTVCGTIAFGYSNKKEAIEAIAKTMTYNGHTDFSFIENLEKRKVMKTVKDGDDYYYWGDTCECCGTKNAGFWSWCDLN